MILNFYFDDYVESKYCPRCGAEKAKKLTTLLDLLKK